MSERTISSVCECQARLFAALNEDGQVIRGWAIRGRGARRVAELAPAHLLNEERGGFCVGWHCPFCVRNVLRRFASTPQMN